ncbi:RING/U-box superfamily protein [Melia azedarach]|uniref:RING/U-box superfamily protein n=1 Tax=Melia azedarach TaxID=155640 RepID=A0ACC1YLZ5_MELAZ|nr:RING/U-box superfamily protein [Melia azedarach]
MTNQNGTREGRQEARPVHPKIPRLQDDLDDVYFRSSSSFRIGNRRWFDNGYVRAVLQEARPVHRLNYQALGASSSCKAKKKEVAAKHQNLVLDPPSFA